VSVVPCSLVVCCRKQEKLNKKNKVLEEAHKENVMRATEGTPEKNHNQWCDACCSVAVL
jgi:hypothetical protein